MRFFGIKEAFKKNFWNENKIERWAMGGEKLKYAASNEILASKINYGSQKH